MRLNFHGRLRDLFGDHFDMAVSNVADAIEGFSRQVNWPQDILVRVIGFDRPEDFHSHAQEIDIMPAMAGGGGKFGKIILGAALVAVSIVAFGQGWIGASLAVQMFVGGGLLALQGILGLFMKAPSTKNASDPEASKYINVNKNTTAAGTPITLAWGRIDLAGQWLSLNSDSSNMAYGVYPSAYT